MENFSSFGFFERWLIRWQKPNVLKCAAAFGLWVTCSYNDLCDVKIGDFSGVAIFLLSVCNFVLVQI